MVISYTISSSHEKSCLHHKKFQSHVSLTNPTTRPEHSVIPTPHFPAHTSIISNFQHLFPHFDKPKSNPSNLQSPCFSSLACHSLEPPIRPFSSRSFLAAGPSSSHPQFLLVLFLFLSSPELQSCLLHYL